MPTTETRTRLVGWVLVVEEASSSLEDVAAALTAAGLDAIRTDSIERAIAIVRSIVLEGLVIAVDGPVGDDDSVRPSMDILRQLPNESACPIAIVVHKPLTAAEGRCASSAKAAVVESKTLLHRRELERLVRHITSPNA